MVLKLDPGNSEAQTEIQKLQQVCYWSGLADACAVRSVSNRCFVSGVGIEQTDGGKERERCRADCGSITTAAAAGTAEETGSSHAERQSETCLFSFIMWLSRSEDADIFSVCFREMLTLKRASTRRRWSVTPEEWRRTGRMLCCPLTEPWRISSSKGNTPLRSALAV